MTGAKTWFLKGLSLRRQGIPKAWLSSLKSSSSLWWTHSSTAEPSISQDSLLCGQRVLSSLWTFSVFNLQLPPFLFQFLLLTMLYKSYSPALPFRCWSISNAPFLLWKLPLVSAVPWRVEMACKLHRSLFRPSHLCCDNGRSIVQGRCLSACGHLAVQSLHSAQLHVQMTHREDALRQQGLYSSDWTEKTGMEWAGCLSRMIIQSQWGWQMQSL